MDIVANNPETVEYRVALFDSSWPLLMVAAEAEGYRLPRVRIPRWTRPAEEINDALRRDWQLNTLVLTILYPGDERSACAVAEVLPSADACFPRDLALQDIEQLSDSDLDPSERLSIRNLIAGDGSIAGPFSRRGWFKEAQVWIQNSIPNRTIEFSRDFRQYNASATYALARLGTTQGRTYWLKATGDPNRHECALTVELSKLFPDHLPKLIAVRKEWNAWVTEDAGQSLGCTQDQNILISAVEAFADLQIQSLDHIAHLRAAGCMDRSLHTLQKHLGPMFEFLEEAMKLQVSTRSRPLTPARLREIAEVVDEACNEMLALAIPLSLVNGDINLDNILFDGVAYRFIDWAEGGIGNPFLTLQQMIQNVTRDGDHNEWVPSLRAAYRAKWRPLLSEDAIDSAFSLMPLLTMADYLYGRGDWLVSKRREDASFQSFARTLARCMDRATAELSLKGAI